MESAGSEKKIQALFSELKLADERVAPEFVRVWTCAQSTSHASPRGFRISLAVAATLIVITLSSLALWWKNWQQTQPPNQAIATGAATTGSLPASPSAPPESPLRGVGQPPRVESNRRNLKVAARRHAELIAKNAAIREDVSISSWQSPTASLLQSPADHVLTSLPQLDRSLTNLKTFLPDTPQ